MSWKPDKFPPCGCSVRGLGGCKMTPFGMNGAILHFHMKDYQQRREVT